MPSIAMLADLPMQLIVLGSGDRSLADALAQAAGDSDRFAFIEGYDETLSHLMFAGADLFVMPSRFEPCGLTQMQAMRYGTIPIVTPVGGLVDTVPDIDVDARRGYGIVARSPDPVAIMSALHRASRRFGQRRLDTVRKRIMAHDWSWDAPAARYRALYDEIS
jgi:starch synthase